MVYLIHFEQKFHHCQHYIGFSKDELFESRLKHHLKGSGSRLIRAVNKAGIKWSVVKTWPDADGNFERKLKNYKKASHFCPICNPPKKENNEKEKVEKNKQKKQEVVEEIF